MNLLLEIGAEEIPDWMLGPALEHLGGAVQTLLTESALGDVQVATDATPRRLVVRATGIIERQPDTEERIWGPAKNAPAGAIAGFAKKQGIAPEALELKSDGKVEKFSCLRKVIGRSASDVLAEALPKLILKTPFPKTMYWAGKGSARFIRPIRWIVGLLDNQVIPFEVAGVWAANESSGHRKLGAAHFPVTFEDYEKKLFENYVILSAAERRKRIRAVAVKYKCDNQLLDTLVNLTEWPTPIVGGFEHEYLTLPKEVLITVMRYHQKYFSVEDSNGNLMPVFVAVTNTDGDPEGLIQHGNERVLRARFNDARFFWDADQKKRLAERVADLANVTFQAKLGTYLEKTERISELVLILIQMLKDPTAELTDELVQEAKVQYAFAQGSPDYLAVRAARLSKADLTTELVKEFTELQGVIGGLYARFQGEPEEVALAIYDHYKPVSSEDSIPRTKAGQLLAVADKLDTVKGCFQVGLIPSGSKDPFALRRAALGIVKILVEGRLRLPLQTLLEGNEQLEEFFLDRIRYYFRDILGFQYDEVNAVISAAWDDLVDVNARLEAVREVRPTADFEPLAASFRRIQNILKQAQFEGTGADVEESLLEIGPETELNGEFERVRNYIRENAGELGYPGALAAIATLRPKVDEFFNNVMVNVQNPAVRQNRLTLLHTMLSEFSGIADFSEIVTSSIPNTAPTTAASMPARPTANQEKK